ncbi:TIM barrel protein [Rhizobium redzepovicii]|uniref:TIM barrel protein n=1 Tax=Rhizobium redzepovicii TaxID=2867518 RepID=UPI001C92C602|nr:TIM barrel protein [Rhizobium redzepovicii]MBY4592598.1 sugar phosphate isomerase/epimerase [Rhizobium redzepovicii]MBY4615408.1 sugar phosphate isomerase/epimerase [Rhizobium redzepovicii]
MHVKLANAPVSWGVDYANDPKNPPWQKVMDEIAEAGYSHTELGPYGFYPTDPKKLASEFQSRGLTVAAGFVFQVLHDPAKTDAVLENAARTVELLSAVGGRYLVTIDHISEERMATAGRRDLAKKLSESQFEHMIGLIDRIADIALAAGVKPVIHQHAGCYIEFEDEIEGVLQRLDPERVGICIDTGHMAYAGIDPVAFYERHAKRVQYFHFKDIDCDVHKRVLAEKIPFLTAVEHNIFCPMGAGVVDWEQLAKALKTHGYDGAANIEQDIDPTISFDPLGDARKSLAYLKSVGF